MTINTPPLGRVTERVPQVASYTISASAIRPTVNVVDAVTPPSPPPTPPVFVTENGVASSPDLPGMSPYPIRAFYFQNQNDAIKSAAQNTAIAFGLNAVTAADQASIVSNATFRRDIGILPDRSTITTFVVIPP